MKKHMILALPAVIFLRSQFLVSYLAHQGRNMEKKELYSFSLALVFIFFLSSVLKIEMSLERDDVLEYSEYS